MMIYGGLWIYGDWWMVNKHIWWWIYDEYGRSRYIVVMNMANMVDMVNIYRKYIMNIVYGEYG